MTPAYAEYAPASGSTVLVIEDNADQWVIIQWAFREGFPGVQPVWINDPAQAIMYLETLIADGEPLPRLILLDAYLPHLEQGLKTLALLKAQPSYQMIPALMLTRSSDRQDMRDCYNQGCNSYIIKPASFPQWRTLLAQLRYYWGDVAQLATSA